MSIDHRRPGGVASNHERRCVTDLPPTSLQLVARIVALEQIVLELIAALAERVERLEVQ